MGPTQIDAVAMTRRIRDAHAEQLKDATPGERIEFYREKARRFHARLAERFPSLDVDPVRPGERHG
jgi:hypothetical protein